MSEVLILTRPDLKPVHVVKVAIVEWYTSDYDANHTHISLLDGKFQDVMESVEAVNILYNAAT